MINVNIISKVEIPAISEATITKLIEAEILKNNPELTINSVSFERKLTPSRIVAIVDAQLGGKSSAPATQVATVEETVESPSEETAASEEVVPNVEEPDDKPMASDKPQRKKVFG